MSDFRLDLTDQSQMTNITGVLSVPDMSPGSLLCPQGKPKPPWPGIQAVYNSTTANHPTVSSASCTSHLLHPYIKPFTAFLNPTLVYNVFHLGNIGEGNYFKSQHLSPLKQQSPNFFGTRDQCLWKTIFPRTRVRGGGGGQMVQMIQADDIYCKNFISIVISVPLQIISH